MELMPPTLLSHLLNQRTYPGSRASRSSSRVEGAAPCRRRGARQSAGAQAGTRHMGRSQLTGWPCPRLGSDGAVSTSDSSRARLQNGLLLGSAGRGGFSFLGVTAATASIAVGGDEVETIGGGTEAPGSDMSVFARRADFPPCVVGEESRRFNLIWQPMRMLISCDLRTTGLLPGGWGKRAHACASRAISEPPDLGRTDRPMSVTQVERPGQTHAAH